MKNSSVWQHSLDHNPQYMKEESRWSKNEIGFELSVPQPFIWYDHAATPKGDEL